MKLTMKNAINKALDEEMAVDPSVFIIGEDIGIYGGAFGVTAGLLDKYGPERVVETPISEASLMGVVTGSALMGMRPVFEIMFMDFTTLIFDQILNHAAKLKYMFGGCPDIHIPWVVRTPFGGGRAYGASHSQSLEGFYLHVPGLKIVAPSNSNDARALLRASIRDNNPVLFIENKLLYNEESEVFDEPVPIGKARVVRPGDDVTIVSFGRMLKMSIDAALYLEKQDIACEVIDLRTIAPIDMDTVSRSVSKTGRLVTVEEGTLTGGVGAELAAKAMERCFFDMESAPVRVASMDLPIPYSPVLEKAVLPDVKKIVDGCLRTLEY